MKETQKAVRYKIKYQDANIVVIKFFGEDIFKNSKDSEIIIEYVDDEYWDTDNFWQCLEDVLAETKGVFFAMVEGYEVIIIKDPNLPNWGCIVNDVLWNCLFFFNFGGSFVQISKKGEEIGEPIFHRFDARTRG